MRGYATSAAVSGYDREALGRGDAVHTDDAMASVDEAVCVWAISEYVEEPSQVPPTLDVLTLERIQPHPEFAPKEAVKEAVDLCLRAWGEEYGDPDEEPDCSFEAYNAARVAVADAFIRLASTLKVTRYRQVGSQTLSRDEVVAILRKGEVLK